MSLRFLTIMLCGIAVACASSTTGGRRAACQLTASDSAYASGRPLYRSCNVDREARFISDGRARPDFNPSTMRSTCYSVDLEFVVDSTGKPETATAKIARDNDRGFAEAVLATITSWRYEPALRNGVPVRQIVTSHQSMATMVVVAPAGSPPPVRPPNSPKC